jgi:CubicO group peptidase (beta-lactamase class C family)
MKYIPSFKYNPQTWSDYLANNRQAPSNYDSEHLDPITLRHLGSHTSGLGRDWPTYNVDEFPDVPPNLPVRQWPTLDEQLQAIAETPLIAPPGFLTVYSNTGFSVLGAALAAANSMAEGIPLPYSDLLKRDLFGPLGMNGSSFIASEDNAAHLAIPKNPAEVVSLYFEPKRPQN